MLIEVIDIEQLPLVVGSRGGGSRPEASFLGFFPSPPLPLRQNPEGPTTPNLYTTGVHLSALGCHTLCIHFRFIGSMFFWLSESKKNKKKHQKGKFYHITGLGWYGWLLIFICPHQKATCPYDVNGLTPDRPPLTAIM